VAAEEPDSLLFLVKNMGVGSWSSKVVTDIPFSVRTEGPYGGPGFAPGHCDALLLVGGGVGISSLARLWQAPPAGISRVELVWVVRCPEAVEWLAALVPDVSSERLHGSIHVFVTRQATRERRSSPTWAAGVNSDDRLEPEVPEVEARARSVTEQLASGPVGPGPQQSHSWHGAGAGDEAAELQRQVSWVASRDATAGGSELARRAAELAWDQHQPVQLGPVTLRTGRPDLPQFLREVVCGGDAAAWGVIACGPQVLVGEARRFAADHGVRFHAEEFAW